MTNQDGNTSAASAPVIVDEKGQPARKRQARPESFRVGLMLHDTSVTYPLLTVTVIGDGSLIVSPRAESRVGWRVATARHAAAGAAFGTLRPMFDEAVRCAESRAPRLNYHQSGVVTAKDDVHGEHLRLRLPPYPSVDALQVFTFRQEQPCSLPAQHEYTKKRHRTPERGDQYVVSHDGPPPAVLVTGILYAETSVPNWDDDLEGHDTTGFVMGRRVEHIVTLGGHGHRRVLIVRPKIDWRPTRGLARTTLAGVCATAEHPSDSLTITSCDGLAAVSLMQSEDLPEFPMNPRERSDSGGTFKRTLGGPAISMAQHQGPTTPAVTPP